MVNELREKKPVDVVLSEYKPWACAGIWNTIVADNKLEKLKEYLLVYFPNGLSQVQLNRILSFSLEIPAARKAKDTEEFLSVLFSELDKLLDVDSFLNEYLQEYYGFDDYVLDKTIVIPEGVQDIDDWDLSHYTMTEIKIPNGVQYIGRYAFLSCVNLKSITIPDSVEFIGNVAFGYCRCLESVILSRNVTNIEKRTFFHCEKLTSVTIPKSVTTIKWGAFESCFSLSEIDYEGTKEAWELVKKERCWRKNSGIRTIKCTDGIIKLPKS